MNDRRFTDIHMHVVPGVDDGSSTLEESLEILRIAAEQGTDTVIATPHSWGSSHAAKSFEILRAAAEQAGVPVRLFFGMEIANYDEPVESVISALRSGRYATLNGTDCVLTEFSPYGDTTEPEALNRLRAMLDAGFIPVIAHAERYAFTTMENMAEAKRMGCRIQINLYSLEQERQPIIRDRAQSLVRLGLADLLGTDTHRLRHRPPNAVSGLQWLDAHCDADRALDLRYRTADALLRLA